MVSKLRSLLTVVGLWIALAVPAFCQSALPEVEHVLIIDTSGSMSDYRPSWGQYGTYEGGFSQNVLDFLGTLLNPDGKFLRGESPAVLYPCSLYGKREQERRQAYEEASQGLTLQDVAQRLGQRNERGRAVCPGPDGDGAMGNEGMLQIWEQAVGEAKSRHTAPVRIYWFLTDNGFDDSQEKLPESFYRLLSYEGDQSLAQVWFAPLRKLPEGNGDLVLYIAIQEDTPGLWQKSWSVELADTVLDPRLAAMWPTEDFKRRVVDLRGTYGSKNEDGCVALLADPKDFQRCLTPIPNDAFEGPDSWCSLRVVPSVTAGREAYSVEVLDNHSAEKSGYENAASVRCNIRPTKGWNICNVNMPGGVQPYTVASPTLSAEEKQILSEGLHIEFGQAATISKGLKRGTKPVVWTIVCNDEAKKVLNAHSEGVEVELTVKMPTTIDFSKLKEIQQSGLDKELFMYIAHLDLLERFIMGVGANENKVQCEWLCENPVRLCLNTGAGDWLERLFSGCDPNSALGKLGSFINSSTGRKWLWPLLLLLLVLLILAIILAIWLGKCLKNRAKRPRATKNNEQQEDLDALYDTEEDDYDA